MSTQPLVTIYIPTCNRRALLQRAVESALAQTHSTIEVIVVDDKSDDDTVDYLASMAQRDPRLRYHSNARNSGACFSRNRALADARGEFITGLDDDDYIRPNHVESLLATWQRHADRVAAVFPESAVQLAEQQTRPVKKPRRCRARDLLCSNWIGNQILTRTAYLRHIGGFDEAFPMWQDLECWYRLLSHYNADAVTSQEQTYIIDASHPHERISKDKGSKLEAAFTLFCQKHQLSSAEQQVMWFHVLQYRPAGITLKDALLRIACMPAPINIVQTLRIYASGVKKKIMGARATD